MMTKKVAHKAWRRVVPFDVTMAEWNAMTEEERERRYPTDWVIPFQDYPFFFPFHPGGRSEEEL